MGKLDKIDIQINGIGHYLMNNKLKVPKYQRYYAWEDKHVEDLYNDIENAIYNGVKEYFIGSIVVKNNEDQRNEVVDGQQRLATILILLIAIRNYVNKFDKQKAWKITNDFIASQNLKTEDIDPHLILNDTDNEFFEKYLFETTDNYKDSPRKLSHKRLLNAFKIANNRVNKINGEKDNVIKLIEWIEYIQLNVRVIWVEVPDYSNAFTIFETLNDRGLDLAISDLLKNYIFHKADKSIETAQSNWISMISTLESAVDETIVVPYIRYLWSSIHGNVREKELYDKIKEKIKSKQAAMEFSNLLQENSALYLAILHSDHDFWVEFGTKTRNDIKIINLLGMVQIRPLLLALLVKFKKSDVVYSLTSLVSLIVRLLISGTLSSGVFETNFSNAAVKIRKGEINNKKQLFAELKPIIPNDTKFKEEFSKANVSKSNLAKYYLSCLENFNRNKGNSELIPTDDENIVNLEHILPKTYNLEWKNFSEDEHGIYYKKLGNQTLLNAISNSSIGNQDFNIKKQYYKKSEFIITKSIADNKYWK
jgi:uncharacterized protein with ParB-like and HNH nuclease domain